MKKLAGCMGMVFVSGFALADAAWIGGTTPNPSEGDYKAFFADRPNAVLTKTFAAKSGESAVWKIAAPAMCDAFVNGTRITATALVPWTDFKFRVLEDAYDVSALLRDGENELRLELGNGWWNPLPMQMWGYENLRDYLPVGEPCVRAELTLTAKDGYALSTGFYSTHYLLEVLTAHGDAEIAGRVVTHEGFPGWFHMMDRGATTLWETWAETDDIYSQNHPMFGSVAGWLMRGVLGIRVAEDAVGCDKVVIEPHAVAGITWANGHLDTPKGRIRVSWKLVDGKLQVDSSVPDGVKVVTR